MKLKSALERGRNSIKEIVTKARDSLLEVYPEFANDDSKLQRKTMMALAAMTLFFSERNDENGLLMRPMMKERK